MSLILSGLPITHIKTPVDLLIAAGVSHGVARANAGALKEYYSGYPYYPINDVFKCFKVVDRIAINIFDMNEMPIINGTYFINAAGIEKLLKIFSVNIRSPFKTNIVMNKTKWPLLYRATEWPVISIPHGPRIRLADFPADIRPVCIGTVDRWVQLTKGCTQSHLSSHALSIGRDSPNVKTKRGTVIAKKYRPLLAERSVSREEFIEEMRCAYPTLIAGELYNIGSAKKTLSHSVPSSKPGFVVEFASGVLAVAAAGVDPSDSLDVIRACPVTSFDAVATAISNGWTMDEIILKWGRLLV